MIVRKLSRRDVLKSGAGGLLVLGIGPLGCTQEENTIAVGERFVPNVFVSMHPDGAVEITVSRSEMGQGVRTSLPRIVADELEASLDRVTIKQATGNPVYGDQNTDGSKSVRMMWEPLRNAGAMARNMLEQAAADQWGVAVSEVKARDHGVDHESTGQRIDYSDLVGTAAALDAPAEPRLKDPSEFRYIGKSAAGVDREAIVTGSATYGYDAKLPGMKYAAIARAPVLDARIRSYDTKAAEEVRGVERFAHVPFTPHPRVFAPEEGIAVIADSSWAALRGRDALEIDWDLGENVAYNTADYRRTLRDNLDVAGNPYVSRGDVDAGLAADGQLLESVYETPMLAHTPMEPPVATAWVKENGDCELWVPAQDAQDVRGQVGDWLGIDHDRVTVNVTLLGGGFGRKSQFDFIIEAVEVSRQAGAPVKVLWTREDDIRNCYYHAETVQLMRARLGDDGMPQGWLMRCAYPSIQWMWNLGQDEPVDWEIGMGWTNMPFDVPNVSIESCKAPVPIRIGWLRSVTNVWHAFSINGFVDEMAEAAGEDPVAYRLRLLGEDRLFDAPNEPPEGEGGESFNGLTVDSGRYRRVLELVAEKTDWGKALPDGHFRGIAVHNSFYSYAATVVEIAVDSDGTFRVISVDTAVDCGRIVNPDGVVAQVEGATIFGLTLALYGDLTVEGGRVQQSNFGDYRIMRIHEAPDVVRAHLTESDEVPTGIGEPPTPTVAPALASALYAASGQRIRRLPLLSEWNRAKNA